MLAGSTPPLMWNNVGGVILTTGLYGSGALLARELIRRRGLGWSNLALLGAAYGVLEEGLALQSWFNPTWANPPDAARFLGVKTWHSQGPQPCAPCPPIAHARARLLLPLQNGKIVVASSFSLFALKLMSIPILRVSRLSYHN